MANMFGTEKDVWILCRVKCLKTVANTAQREGGKLAACWKQIQEGVKWLNCQRYTDGQPEIDEILDICKALIRTGKLGQEDWNIRKQVLRDIIHNAYYSHYNCKDVMSELSKQLCADQEEHLACAKIMGRLRNWDWKNAGRT